ncbi:MAG TPA: hypothetical protein VNF07_01175 [Acidimicrobiales bacterium]|nr:hypothetical protein [Acidimicrobiales bacterium]
MSTASPGGPPEPPGVERPTEGQVAWGLPTLGEHRWPASLAVAVAIVFQLLLPDKVVRGLGPHFLLPSVEGALCLLLLAINPGRITKEEQRLRVLGIALIALINLANVVSLLELIHALLGNGRALQDGRGLVEASLPVWLTNIIVFGLWYWELDRGGPAARTLASHPRPDFLFPQMSTPECASWWTPKFYDYLYTSFTNATAFSPTDTMPLTGWAKLLMAVQSLASLLTVAVVVSRAVNVL